MKLLKSILLLAVCVPLSAFITKQAGTKDAAEVSSDFLLDQSKPYVYLEVDHVGARKPLRDGEPNTGIWLRMKNNCKLPIVIMALGAPPTKCPAWFTKSYRILIFLLEVKMPGWAELSLSGDWKR